MTEDRVFPRGMRPVAMDAVSERERMEAHPHRHASGKMFVRAMKRQAVEQAEERRQARRKRREK